MQGLTDELSARFAGIALGHVTREYPNKLDHVLADAADARTPRALHPVFFGSFDWHSCVHGYWLLARLLRARPQGETAERIRTLFDHMLVPAKIAGECAYLSGSMTRGFERPYGWAWLLKLAAELRGLDEPRWGEAVAPLAHLFAERLAAFLPLATYPIRTGSHSNTAFALRLAADYAEGADEQALSALLLATARRWYGADEGCEAWGEPGGDDFLSPALIEAEAMRRLLPAEDFSSWFDRFFPRLGGGSPVGLFRPVAVSDRSDGKIAHLDGLNLSRAWCWRALAGALAEGDARAGLMRTCAERHLVAALPHVAGHYAGEHWLASFAVLALEE